MVLTGSIDKMSPEEPSGLLGWEGVYLVGSVGERNPRGAQYAYGIERNRSIWWQDIEGPVGLNFKMTHCVFKDTVFNLHVFL